MGPSAAAEKLAKQASTSSVATASCSASHSRLHVLSCKATKGFGVLSGLGLQVPASPPAAPPGCTC